MFDVTAAADLFSLKGKTAVITGASAGLGAHLARVLATAGARTALVARRRDLLDKIVVDLPGSIALEADLADIDQVDTVARRALDELGRVDILVNNAAYIAGGVKAEDETSEQIQRTLAVNLHAPIRLGQAFVPGMFAAGSGSIVNVTSIVAHGGIGRFPQATYAATKGGLEALTREWAAQWSRRGVRINNLSPGFVESEMTEPILGDEKVRSWIAANTLIGRHGVPADFDGALLFLASDASRYVTGQTLRVDGGWSAR
ncbi:SDR family oxidoreductase [Jatrophihabitans sp.]|uniref:SDR family NAD(P)-dependent oxidoreductase n=1 Tax=Jatrophihabitans sp. TaxID=1932789 RepID=UPI0030C772A8|nr:short-chain dehydrogenase/reductase [Jatrophihabitans sp.]